MANYTIAEEYTLPSQGKIYNVPFDPKVRLRSMTIQEVMRRQNKTKSNNAILCEIIDDCLVTKLPISCYDLAYPDYEYLLHKLRVVTHGTNYPIEVGCPHCDSYQKVDINLDELQFKEVDMEEFNKHLIFKLPTCGKEIKLRIPTARLDDTIENKISEFEKMAPDNELDMTPVFRLETMIDTVDGSKMSYIELQELIKHLSYADYNYIDQKIDKLKTCFGLNKKIDLKCKKCGGDFSTFFRFTTEFLRPQID